MNLFLTKDLSLDEAIQKIKKSLHILGSVTVYYDGEKIGKIQANAEKVTINNNEVDDGSFFTKLVNSIEKNSR